MTVYSRVDIAGVRRDGHVGAEVERSTSDYDSGSSFTVRYPNPYGRYSSTYNVGDEVLIYACKDVAGYWGFDGDATDRFRGRDGSASNVTYTTGLFRQCAVFNGTTSVVTFPNPATVFASNTSWSVGCWFKITSYGTNERIVGISGSAGTEVVRIYSPSSGNVALSYRNGSGTITDAYTFALSTGTWCHAAITYDGSTFSFYVNGSIVATAASTFAGFGGSLFSAGAFNSSNYLNGSIEELFAFDRVLDSFEIGRMNTEYGWPGNPFFGGYVEDKDFEGSPDSGGDVLVLSGRSYVSIPQDASVQPVTYSNEDVGDIVVDLCSREAPTIDVSNVTTLGVVLRAIGFSRVSLYDALKELATLADAYFYVDSSKKLYFKKLLTSSSNVNLVAGVNIDNCSVTESRKPMYNRVTVYGDRILVDAGRKTFTATAGSVYTLDYKPHNVGVFVAGSTVSKQGGILNFVAQGDPGSGTQFLVDYNNRQIVFVSGTFAGNNIPAVSTSFVVEYQRQRQIIAYAQDDTSIAAYQPKSYDYIDKNIKEPLQAKAIALALLDKNAHPFKEISVDARGFADVVPGQYAGVYEPYYGLSGSQFGVIRAKYSLTPDTQFTENVVTFTLNRKMIDGADIIKQSLLDIKRLRAQETVEGEFYTRFQLVTGSAGARVSAWSVATRSLGSSFILGHPTLGVLGTASPQPYLGDSRGALSVQYSGADA